MNQIEKITNAAMNGDMPTIQEILNENPDLVNTFSQDGWTPLHLASYFGKEEAARLLLSLGADIHARAKNSNENMPLHAAVANKQVKLVELLIKNGADINAKQSGGWTSLHEAALLGNTEIVELLIKEGANIQLRKDDEKTPLDIALEKEQSEVVNLIKQHINTAS
ncbi:ankyrin repeat domain-containing protein [Bacillus sp. 166amftsu]|uniref:ankyrin repeat domain-containing protein n=1 Tax=Bacillus sp. 166amftsu TaxID=1761753 RepID=UPI000899D276|nr:ankyrin repeat domain-containing protein [Bacillus sp. 166amftsu]SDZ43165.1 Ankyrin repeat-containing protein [Bacillus sp. 166amftsu]